ncbi:MAG: hypothetical protein K2W94_01580 [Alphaproteobacteria bacterium]|nr:hypothetical protein [Alphaproteobacteria bacterium]
MKKILKLSIVAVLLAVTSFSAEAKGGKGAKAAAGTGVDHSKKVNCQTDCDVGKCGKKMTPAQAQGCADCKGREVFDCGNELFIAQGCEKQKDSSYKKMCQFARKMLSKASVWAWQHKDKDDHAKTIVEAYAAGEGSESAAPAAESE